MSISSLSKKILCACFAITLFFASCKQDTNVVAPKTVNEYDYSIVKGWDDVFLNVERHAGGYRPGPAPRALAYIGLANYEACVSGMEKHKSIAYLYPGLKLPAIQSGAEYHWPSVVNASYAYMMSHFFTSMDANVYQQILDFDKSNTAKFEKEIATDVALRSKQYGEAVASAVWEWSKTDTYGHEAYLDPFGKYDWKSKFKSDGDWVPVSPNGKPMFPNWGSVRHFAISDADRLCRAPLKYSTDSKSALYVQALEVYSQNSPTLSYDAEWIGEFWSDDLVGLTFSPGPRWIAIADQVYEREKSSLEIALLANAKVGLAINDAAVACWYSKYYYNVERPVSYINRVIDPKWKPALFNPLTGATGVTPSFPAYPSGHSTMGGAAAEALASVFGYSYAMTDNCHKNRVEFEGKARSFDSFKDMADENGISRIPLGVHFRMDCEEGVRLGTVVGRKVNNIAWDK
jgi:hypothetical protein